MSDGKINTQALTEKDKKYYSDRFRRIRNALDVLIGELESTESNPPRQRRNLKDERVRNHELNFLAGKWSKPKKIV